ncbi:hypothetical protein ACSFA0_23410 [Variovorax sp. LT1P1]|uniref:hypothetical protein n=1 Tax=Variovorax sp. LT1P1 TaxID=3443730 RepID=UPI003F4473F7
MKFNCIAAGTLFLAAMASSHAFELKGFKSVEFGASSATLTANGLNCRPQGTNVECSGADTLFGLSGTVRAWLRNDKVTSIRMVVVDKKPVNLVDAYSQALGKPKTFIQRYPRQDVTVSYWTARDGTSVSTFTTGTTLVVKNPDTGEERHSATADYMDKASTIDLLAKAKKAEQSKRDF